MTVGPPTAAGQWNELRALGARAEQSETSCSERALLHRDAAYLALDLGELAPAMTHALSALELALASGDGPLQVKAHVTLALVQAEGHDDLGAARQFARARTLALRLGDHRGVALVAVNASHVQLERREYLGAVEELLGLLASEAMGALHCPESRALLETFHVNFVVGAAEALLAGSLSHGTQEAARQLQISADWLMGEADLGTAATPQSASERLDALTCVALWLGDQDLARRRADDHVRLARAAELPLLYGRALLGRSRVHTHGGLLLEAVQDAHKAVRTFDAAGSELWAARAREALARIHAQAGQFQSAFECQLAVTQGVERLYRDYHQQRALVDQIGQQAREAEVRAQALAEAALRDPLTGAPNRTRAMQVLAELHGRAHTGAPSAVALLDLDHFKHVNDTYGHLTGDEVLIRATHLMTQELREQDLLARLGGEEFLVILTDVHLSEAATTCERLRAALHRATWDTSAPHLQLSVSVGLAPLDGTVGITETLKAADQALYAAKAAGRNALRVAEVLCPPRSAGGEGSLGGSPDHGTAP